MKLHPTSALGLLLALFVGATGCQSETGPEPSVAENGQALDEASASDEPGELANEPSKRHGKHGKLGKHHGPERLLQTALEELELSPEQRASVESSLAELRPSDHEANRADHAKALAAAIRTGSVDAKSVVPRPQEMEARMNEHRGRLVKALDQLHATLTSEQRRELVATLESRREKKLEGKRHGKHEGKHGPMGERGGKHAPMDFMLRGIDLSDEQRTKIETALAQAGLAAPARGEKGSHFEAMKAQKKALMQAFASDSFDAAALVPEAPEKLAAGPHRFVDALAVIVPLLDESQRAELADRVERGSKHAMGPKRGKRGGHGRHAPRAAE